MRKLVENRCISRREMESPSEERILLTEWPNLEESSPLGFLVSIPALTLAREDQ
jgi:hypothetical protein